MTIVVWVSIALAALLSLSITSAPLGDLIKQPLQVLWGSHQTLEVSENFEPVEEATRRLLKPFGVVRLNRRISKSDSNP